LRFVMRAFPLEGKSRAPGHRPGLRSWRSAALGRELFHGVEALGVRGGGGGRAVQGVAL